jgi:hypothetical protein
VLADLDDLLTALFVFADDFLPKRDPSRPGRRPRITDAEVICLAVAQAPRLPQGAALLALRKAAARPSVQIDPRPIRLQQARSGARARDRHCSAPGADLAVVVRWAAAGRRYPSTVRVLARDGEAIGVRRPPSLRLVRGRARATSGASSPTCWQPRTGCRSPSSSPGERARARGRRPDARGDRPRRLHGDR